MKLTNEQKQEIADQQSQKNETKRVTSPELEKILYEALPVLKTITGYAFRYESKQIGTY